MLQGKETILGQILGTISGTIFGTILRQFQGQIWVNYKALFQLIEFNAPGHGLQTPREEIAFTAQPKIQSQIFRYG